MKVTFSEPTEYDRGKFYDALTSDSALDGRVKITAVDDEGHTAELFIEQAVFDRLGEEYIRSHISVYHSSFVDGWFIKLSENDFHNDPERNPEKVIRVKFDGIEGGTGREVYKGIDTGRYYLRENYFPRENFAKWFICGKRRTVDDGDEPRANLIFECDGQQEKVRYDDWNGVAAYSDTYNKDFCRQDKTVPGAIEETIVYVYHEYNDSEAYGEQVIKVFSCLPAARKYLRERVETHFDTKWDELTAEIDSKDTMKMDYVSIDGGENGIDYFVLEPYSVN